MPRVIGEESEEAKELNKFEQHFSRARSADGNPIPPGNPYKFRPYPKMLYMGRKTPDGRILVLDQFNEQWSRGSVRVVNSEDEERKAHREGWRPTQKEALDRANGFEKDISTAAAEGIYAEARMGEKARAEASAAREASADHLGEIKEKPKRKYVRKAKLLAN